MAGELGGRRRLLPRALPEHAGDPAAKRAEQQLEFTWALVRDELDQRLRRSPGVKRIRDDVRRELLAGELTAPLAADRLVAQRAEAIAWAAG